MKRFAKILFSIVAVLAAVAVVGHFIWKYSGSNQWKLAGEYKGIKVYSLKVPGDTLMQFKASTKVKSNLTAAMTLAQDVGVCKWVKCFDSKMIERVDEREQYYIFKWKYPLGFSPREFLIKERFSRDPATKALLVEVIGTPEKMPADPCCVRMAYINNKWLFTPLPNGEMGIQYHINNDSGGLFPYVLHNLGTPRFVASSLSKMQMILDDEMKQYPNAKYQLLED